MNKKEEELIKVIIQASVGLGELYSSEMSEELIKIGMVRIGSNLLYHAQKDIEK